MKHQHKFVAGLACVLALLPMALSAAERPNFEGTWQLQRPQVALTPVGGGEPPFTRDGRRFYRENRKAAGAGDFSFDQTAALCSAPGLPRLMLVPGRIRLYQRERVVTLAFEWNRLFRQIELRNVAQIRPEIGTMNGLSFGTWQGDTLVIKSFGFLPDKLLDNYVAASDALELVERLRLVDQDTLEDRITVTDPQTFTRPWEAVLTFKRQADEPFAEDSCLDRRMPGQATLPR